MSDRGDEKGVGDAIRRLEARHRALLDALPHGVQKNDLTGTITYSNETHARMHGYRPGELVGRKIWDLLVSEDERRALQRYLAKLVEQQPTPTPYRGRDRTRDGHTIDVQVDWTYERDDRGKLVGFTSIITDVTDRKRAEEQLRDSRRMLQLVLDAIPVRVFWKNLESVYLGCNRPFAKDAGLDSTAEIMGKDDFVLAWRDQAELYRADDAQVMRTGKPKLNYEEPQTWPDGTELLLRTSKIPLRDDDGKVVGVLGCYEDITQERQLEDQLRQAQKMEALGQLAGGVAHDFNNLLTAILGYVEIATLQLGPEHPVAPSLTEVRKAADRGASLTRQLLAFTRQQVLEPKVVDLNAVVRDIEALLRRTIGEDIELETVLDPALGRLRADRGQLEQILMNLAVNARDAMPQGGRLSVRTANAAGFGPVEAVAGVATGGFVMLRVSDNGCGMDEKTLSRVFEPFFTTKDKSTGTGLGLATVYGIVKQNGGEIRVDSAPGRGATFSIYLPRVEGQVEPAKPAQRRSRGGREVVLLVEDDDGVRDLALQVLDRYGYQVIVAETPESALESCARRRGPIDLLLTDLVLPGMNGVDLIGRVQALKPGTRVLTMSGYTDRQTVDGQPLGSRYAFLRKPFAPDELLAKVRGVLDRTRSEDS